MIKNGYTKIPNEYKYVENLESNKPKIRVIIVVLFGFILIKIINHNVFNNLIAIVVFICGFIVGCIYEIYITKYDLFNLHEQLHKIGIKLTSGFNATIYQNWEERICKTYLPNGEVINKKASVISLLLPVITLSVVYLIFAKILLQINFDKASYFISGLFLIKFGLACNDIYCVFKILNKYKHDDILIQYGINDNKIYKKYFA